MLQNADDLMVSGSYEQMKCKAGGRWTGDFGEEILNLPQGRTQINKPNRHNAVLTNRTIQVCSDFTPRLDDF